MAVSLQVDIKDHGIEPLLQRIQARFDDPRPLLSVIGETVRASVVRNFEQGGRPDLWAPHSAATVIRRGPNARILWGTKRLEGSINWQASSDSVTVGTNTVYAAVHQFGAKKGSFGLVAAQVRAHARRLRSGKKTQVRAHTRKQSLPWGNIPARPFMMVQDEDWDFIREGITRLILG